MKRCLIVLVISLCFSQTIIANPQETLIGGKPVGKGEYPEVVRIRSCVEGRCASCTASIVGPKALLTAGHCLYKNEKKIQFEFEQNIYTATCESHPLYPDVEDIDMALCKIDRRVKVRYAHITNKPVSMEERVTLIGYGCLRNENPRGGNDGILRVGTSEVVQLPNPERFNSWFYTRSSTALCYGDSGGPSFKRIKNPKRETHFVAGVNSRGNIKDLSLLTALYLDKSQEFMKNYATKNNVVICGINSSKECMVNNEEDQEDDSKQCKRESKKVEFYTRKLNKWENLLNKCFNQ